MLASGDPLFCGIGRTLLARFGPERVRIAPGISSLQLLAARCRLPWDDLPWVTLHGRPATPEAEAGVPALLLGHQRVAVLTDRHYTPARIAALLLAYLDRLADNFNDGERGEDLPAEVLPFAVAELAAGWRMTVGQRLGEADEELYEGDLATVAARSFAEPNIVLLENPVTDAAEFFPFGLTSAEISHRGGLITKDEARAVALHRLRLPPGGVLWDVGAGSGSVGLEAVRLAPGLRVFAVERRPELLAHIRANIIRFRAFAITPVAGEAPEILNELPDPDRVFIGGSHGRLAEIIAAAANRLAPGGRIVINAVTAATAAAAPELLRRHGLTVSRSRVEASIQPETATSALDLIKQNPITIITGCK